MTEPENVDVVLNEIRKNFKEEPLQNKEPQSGENFSQNGENFSAENDQSKNGERSEFTKSESPAHNTPEKSHHPSSSESEEIVPLENLDSYISSLKQRRGKREQQAKEPVSNEDSEEHLHSTESDSNKEISRNSSNTSFDIDISDYESDDDNLEVTLQNWQTESVKASSNNLIAKLSPKRVVPGLLKPRSKWKRGNVELPDKLMEILK